MIWRELLHEGEQRLAASGVPEAKLNAWYLFAACFETSKSDFFLNQERNVETKLLERYYDLIRKRSERIPLEYLLGETEFMGLPFSVNENVLIPRQDTECLVEEVLSVCAGLDVLDLCTGSGCIGISLKKLGLCKSVTLSDISREALIVAKENALKNQVDVNLIRSDLFEQLEGSFDLIVSNPPYIESEEIQKLMPEVREHEPKLALDGSADGLLFYRRIIKDACKFLKKEGYLFFEIGCSQGKPVSEMMEKAGFKDIKIKKDYCGLDRIVSGRIW